MKVAVSLEFNHFDAIANALPGAVAEVVETSARAIEGKTKLLAPVDTGNLRASYQSRPIRIDGTRWLIGTNVEYAPPVEYGHHTHSGSFTPAQPHLTPAAEEERQNFIAAMRDLEKHIR